MSAACGCRDGFPPRFSSRSTHLAEDRRTPAALAPFLAILGGSEATGERMRSRAPRRTPAQRHAEAQGVRFGRRAAGPAEREQAERPPKRATIKANRHPSNAEGAFHE